MYRELKYQEAALNALEKFFRHAYNWKNEPNGIANAFKSAVLAQVGGASEHGRSFAVQTRYNADIFEDKNVPWVCLRLPTGAGKTYLAARSIGITAREWLGGSRPFTLWLVPSDIILQQTLKALQYPDHPYRKALSDVFGNDLDVIGLGDLPRISTTDWRNKAIVLVCTGQALKIDANKKDMRNVYAHTEDFEAQFVNFDEKTADQLGLERVTLEEVKKAQEKAGVAKLVKNAKVSIGLTEADVGKLKWSAINVFRMQRPIVIVDEAHRSQGDLSKDVLQRVNASCVIEFTATPKTNDQGQVVMNVLHHVSAQVLKAEDMIKLPVYVKEHVANWQQTVADAVFKRAELEQISTIESQNGARYLRPIMLLQAEAKRENDATCITPDVLKAYLIATHKISEDQIAIATGDIKDLAGIDLMHSECVVRFVITVHALVEGWDCPFAYVLCSVRNMKSNTAIVQLLGRLLRMPYATRQNHEALNSAYAYTVTDRMGTAAGDLVSMVTDKKVGLGFEKLEASDLCQTNQPSLLGADLLDSPLFAIAPKIEIEVSKEPIFDGLDVEDRPNIEYINNEETGKKILVITGEVSEKAHAVLVGVVPKSNRDNVTAKIDQQNYSIQRTRSPSLRGEKFALLPRLCVSLQGELILLEPETLTGLVKWDLSKCSPELNEFAIQDGKVSVLDMEGEKFRGAVKDMEQTQLVFTDANATVNDLLYSLEKELQSEDVTSSQMAVYLNKVLTILQKDRGFELSTLLVYSRSLRNTLAQKIKLHRSLAIQALGTQLLLDADPAERVQTGLDYSFEFKPNAYPVRQQYDGRHKFEKHYYPMIDALKEHGEEFECAKVIDFHPSIKSWVRNLINDDFGFWLPMHHGGRMFPDFVCELNDGRVLLVEYKGGNLITADDAKAKKAIGELWARKSGNVFLMATDTKTDSLGRSVSKQIDDALLANIHKPVKN